MTFDQLYPIAGFIFQGIGLLLMITTIVSNQFPKTTNKIYQPVSTYFSNRRLFKSKK
jgi:hypothetical protein